MKIPTFPQGIMIMGLRSQSYDYFLNIFTKKCIQKLGKNVSPFYKQNI